ncbi:signal peptidase I [Yinghuangia soli]|uniref:Signal peptidase I n=1 Tax=Yinghuangia soli TaxID=2908204 RepID=A0AA41Q059_9ACTN|nr:signal peptidase I [Yinghuangia soli]MCF2528545.1 signal peptidase I [Yinghuangia soli]
MGEVVVGARSAGGDDESGRRPEEPHRQPESGEPGGADSPFPPVGPGDAASPDGPGAPPVPPVPPLPPGPPAAGTGVPAQERPREGAAAAGAGSGAEAGAEAESDAEDTSGRRKKKQRKPAKKGSFWKELPLLLGIALVLALIIKTFLVQAFSIPSESMEDTIKVGDRVLVDKLTPWFGAEPERGEVVVFKDPGGWLEGEPQQSDNGLVRALQKGLSFVGLMPSTNEKDLIKRVIGVGGDTVECCDAEGRILVNGVPLNETYLKPGVAPSDKPFKVTVPKGRLWVMGDNRANSADSRAHVAPGDPAAGTVDKDQVIGRAFTVIWPLGRMHWLGVPDTFDQKGLSSSAAPLAFGAAGAVPLLLWRRRWTEPKRGDAGTGAPPA